MRKIRWIIILIGIILLNGCVYFNEKDHVCLESDNYDNCTGEFRGKYTDEEECDKDLDTCIRRYWMEEYLKGCPINCTRVYENSRSCGDIVSIYLILCRDADHTEIIREVENPGTHGPSGITIDW